MKNFYEVTVIDIDNKLEVDVELIKHDNPDFAFTVNEIPYQSKMYFGLLDQICFSCKISNGAVEVARITINGKEVLPIYQHLARPATNWITTDWKFNIPSPFYAWYHEITGQGWIA
jgi:hypothetical protein